jgi:hypothetical protein
MRTTYETEANRANQERIAAIIARRCNCVTTLLEPYSPIDYAVTKAPFVKDRVDGLLEIKCRNHKSIKEWPYYMLGLKKLLRMKELGDAVGVSTMLVVEWSDALGWVDIRKLRLNCHTFYVGGRTDRPDPENPNQPDPGDKEITIRIALSDFTFFTPEAQ